MSIPFLNQYKGAAQGFEHCSNVDHRRFSRKIHPFFGFLDQLSKTFSLVVFEDWHVFTSQLATEMFSSTNSDVFYNHPNSGGQCF